MTEHNPALGDELLAARYSKSLDAVTGTEIPTSAIFFWEQAQHAHETGIIYDFPDVAELFERVKDLKEGE